MILCIDIGNTNVVMGLYDGERLLGKARFATSNLKTSDEWGLHASSLVQRYHPDKQLQISGAILCSVVPHLTPRAMEMVRTYFQRDCLIVNSQSDVGIEISVTRPQEVGADRIANALAANRIYGTNCIIIDFGTATTFDVVTADGQYLGGAIAPGVETASANLVQKAAQLFGVEISPPSRTIGKTTDECMRSGIFWGQVEMVNGMIVRIEQELQEDCTVILTGGLGRVFAEHLDREAVYNPDVTLEGLRLAYAALS